MGSVGRVVAMAAALGCSVTLATSCADQSESRWATPSEADLAALASATSADTDSVAGLDAERLAQVDIGPVVAANRVRATLRGADVVTVAADRAGRVTRRLPSPGDPVAVNDPLLELAAAPDEADELRLQILRLERDLAAVEGRTADLERIDTELAAALARAEAEAGVIAASQAGTFSHHLVALFENIEPGTPIAEIAVSDEAVAVVDLGADAAALSVGDTVRIETVGGGPSTALSGTIRAIDGSLLTIEPPADADLAIGDRIDVSLDVPTEDALRVVAGAVRSSDGGHFVVIVTATGAWERVPVSLGARGDGVVEIIDPTGRVTAGTTVVLS